MSIKPPNLIVYELNEVPKRVIDHYILHRPYSNISKLYKRGSFIETVTRDSGELHPWSTWPSVHRGVTNDLHDIRFINQDLSCASKYPPIWQVLEKSGISIGIFGSLQSYPPYKGGNVKFYLPDTFSPESKAIPRELELFQRFNLHLAKRNKAVAQGIQKRDITNLSKLIKNNIISISVLLKTSIHMLKEIYDNRNKKRRANIQALISFDVYKKYLIDLEPQYSTFFSNHIASTMHRYWMHSFPEDFGILEDEKIIDKQFNSKSLIKAMDLADFQIGNLLKLQENRGGDLWIISGFGQKAILRNDLQEYELLLEEDSKLLKILQLDYKMYEFIPAMYPDINIECDSEHYVNLLLKNINRLKDINNMPILQLRYKPKQNTVNIIISNVHGLNEAAIIYLDNKEIRIEEAGFKLIKRDSGTGYHSKNGIILFNSDKTEVLKKFVDSKTGYLDICNIFQMTKDHFKIE
ncbi:MULTISPECIES: hypothetical protein [unclassified Prochlorococcus]|uniref:hypothetical protein n=1 Tax=unclassified Prochlorococcus TaxID=2627481 RepID=UPI000533874C|nr:MULTISPECIES: hypothetical protein [unclassified Prochlorococcus]KGG16344.1 hypothetical protein EV07_1513 [Prochlorococcus sp. MIT 0603]KGG17922.1 hypothetical protein EV06_0045 [Prochlorococcus sp. MIT 0602]